MTAVLPPPHRRGLPSEAGSGSGVVGLPVCSGHRGGSGEAARRRWRHTAEDGRWAAAEAGATGAARARGGGGSGGAALFAAGSGGGSRGADDREEGVAR